MTVAVSYTHLDVYKRQYSDCLQFCRRFPERFSYAVVYPLRPKDFQPGVRVESNCQNCGFQQVRINGLDLSLIHISIEVTDIVGRIGGH